MDSSLLLGDSDRREGYGLALTSQVCFSFTFLPVEVWVTVSVLVFVLVELCSLLEVLFSVTFSMESFLEISLYYIQDIFVMMCT
jgi:hypothetical protein